MQIAISFHILQWCNIKSIAHPQFSLKHGRCPKLGAFTRYAKVFSMNNPVTNWKYLFCKYYGKRPTNIGMNNASQIHRTSGKHVQNSISMDLWEAHPNFKSSDLWEACPNFKPSDLWEARPNFKSIGPMGSTSNTSKLQTIEPLGSTSKFQIHWTSEKHVQTSNHQPSGKHVQNSISMDL